MGSPWCEIYGFLKDWQTLIGALIALIAAILTIRVMRRQASDENTRHENQLKRKEMAARAQMPDALSEMIAYIRASGEYLTGQSAEPPEQPLSAITTLKQVIEHIDDKAAQRTFELVSWYQVQRVRMMAEAPPQAEPERGERLYDAVLLQAYANSLFDYARNEATTAPTEKPSFEDMITAYKNTFTLIYTVQNEQQFEGMLAAIERRHKALAAA